MFSYQEEKTNKQTLQGILKKANKAKLKQTKNNNRKQFVETEEASEPDSDVGGMLK